MKGRWLPRGAFLIGAWACAAAAQQPVGPEFRVNTYTTSSQGSPSVASDADGDFVVVWSSMAQDGSGYGVFGQRYSNSGALRGPEFQINAYTTSDQAFPSIASDEDGDFVVVWESDAQDGDLSGVFGQRYSNSGARQGAELQVNTDITGIQRSPSVASDADGDFVVAWHSPGLAGGYDRVFAQRYTSSGARQGAELQVNTFTTGAQQSPSVASDADGDFVVVFDSSNQDGSYGGVFGQRFTSAGDRLGPEFQVNTYTTGQQRPPSVASDADGDFVVVWVSHRQDGNPDTQDGSGYGVFGQRYSSSGARRGAELQINTYTTGDQKNPSVSSDADGDFFVVWESYGQDGDYGGVFGQRYSSSGARVGPELRVNTFTTSSQYSPSVGSAAGGDFVVVWQSTGGDKYGSQAEVFGQRFDLSSPGTPGPSSTPAPTNTPTRTPTATSTPSATPTRTRTSTSTSTASPTRTSTSTASPTRTSTSTGSPINTPPNTPINTPPNTPINTPTETEFNPDEFQVNVQTAGDQSEPSVSSDAMGNFVVVWLSQLDERFVFGRQFAPDAAPLGPELLITTDPGRDPFVPAVDSNPSGNFVVVWNQQVVPGGSDRGIFARRYNSSGQAMGPALHVGDAGFGGDRPVVAIDAAGAFAVAWEGPDGGDAGISLSLHDSMGQPVLTEFQANSSTVGYQLRPDVASDAEGNFAVVWGSGGGGEKGIFLRRFDSLGRPLDSPEFKVNTQTGGTPVNPSVVTYPDGRLFVAWPVVLSRGLRGRWLEPDLTASGPETPLAAQSYPVRLARDAAGLLIVAGDDEDGDSHGVFSSFLGQGTGSLGERMRVNVETRGTQSGSDVTGHQQGRFVAVWSSELQDGDGRGIFGRLVFAHGALRFDEAASELVRFENQSPAHIWVERASGSLEPVTVLCSTQDGTAQAGSDYVAVTSRLLEWAAGEVTPKPCDVTIVNDQDENEGEEHLMVVLTDPAGGAVLGTPAQVQLRIRDETNSYLQFESGLYRSLESVGSFAIQVEREGTGLQPVSVDYRMVETAGGARGGVSCAAGVDFVEDSGTLSWEAGDLLPKEIVLTLCDDFDLEGDESFQVVLENPAAGGVVSVPSRTEVFLQDDPGGRLVISHEEIVEWGPSRPTITISAVRIGSKEGPARVEAEILFNSGPEPDLQVVPVAVEWGPGEDGSRDFTVARPADTRRGTREFRLVNASGAVVDRERGRTFIPVVADDQGCFGVIGTVIFQPLGLNILLLPMFLGWNRLLMRQMARARAGRCASVFQS